MGDLCTLSHDHGPSVCKQGIPPQSTLNLFRRKLFSQRCAYLHVVAQIFIRLPPSRYCRLKETLVPILTLLRESSLHLGLRLSSASSSSAGALISYDGVVKCSSSQVFL